MRYEQVVLVSDKNRKLLAGKRKEPNRQYEIVKNLAGQMEVIPIPKTVGSRLMEVLTSGIWFLTTATMVIVMITMVLWFAMMVAKRQLLFEPACINMFTLLGIYVFLYPASKDLPFDTYLTLTFPQPFIDRYHQLFKKGLIGEGEIISVEILSDSEKKLHYRFFYPEGKEVVGEYITSADKEFRSGQKLVIIYIPDEGHVVL